MSKMGFNIIEDIFEDIPDEVIKWFYDVKKCTYSLFFMTEDEEVTVDNIPEISMIAIGKVLKGLYENDT
ncbi:MAG TPA: hypothetical protein DD377_00505 [Firmicutes bacterium]|nr:hypothetical protein [Bacillota bacterium]